MKLSMWILADWLKKYNPQIEIRDGNCVLERVRFIAADQPDYDSCVFVGHLKTPESAIGPYIFCVNGDDQLILETNDIEQVFNDISDAFECYLNWHHHVLDAIRDGCTIQGILNKSRNLLDDFTFVSDSGYVIKGYCCDTPGKQKNRPG